MSSLEDEWKKLKTNTTEETIEQLIKDKKETI